MARSTFLSRELVTAIEIDAAPAGVWEALSDTRRYPEWNPFIRSIEGSLTTGERLRVSVAPPGGRAMVFRPRVLWSEPERGLSWIGRLVLPGLFDGEHTFEIEPTDASRVRFMQKEVFSGLLVPVVWGSMADATREGFRLMNEALKARVESGGSASGE